MNSAAEFENTSAALVEGWRKNHLHMKVEGALLLFALLLFQTASIEAIFPQTQMAFLYIDPPLLVTETGFAFTVNVMIANVTDLYAWEFNLIFDPFFIECEIVGEGSFLNEARPTIWPSPIIDNENGSIRASCSLIGSESGVNGTGILAYITFLCKRPVERNMLMFAATSLFDSSSEKIPHETGNSVISQVGGACIDAEQPIEPTHVHSQQGLIDPYKPQLGTLWHELYPKYSNVYSLSSWEDNGDGMLGAYDQIDMVNIETDEIKWYHVDRIAITLTVNETVGEIRLVRALEFIGPYDLEILYNPICTYWHEVIPMYSNVYHVIGWYDNGDDVLSPCDYIKVNNTETGEILDWHVEDIATDMILTEKIASPYCSYWHELYPNYCKKYHAVGWEDNGDGMLSPCDKMELKDLETNQSQWYHVNDLTLTLNLSCLFLEFKGGYTHLFEPIADPLYTYWHEVHPTYCNEYVLVEWYDDGDGVLSSSDIVGISATTEQVTYYRVDEISFNLIVTPQPIPSWYTKPPYPDYSPSGMPDFDQRQDRWYWRAWAFPDAIAVWQHYDEEYADWDIYYSIYTDPNMWWTLGCKNAGPLVADSLAPGPASFLSGDDLHPAISWYSSNYSICVWQHFNYEENDWDIWYSLFTPNIGWTWPTPVARLPGADEDPAIAFDINGWAVCVWVHTDLNNDRVIYYSLWNPATLSWSAAKGIAGCFGNAWMPEVAIDSLHNVLVVWTDGNPLTETVWYSWAQAPPPGPPLAWSPPTSIAGCPLGINWHKGLSPDNLGNNLIDFSYPSPRAGGEPIHYAQFTSPEKVWKIPPSNLTVPSTHGEHPDLAFDLNNNAISVYTHWPTGQIYFSFWNGLNWAPIGGAFAATAATGTLNQEPALAFISNNKAVLVWVSAINTTSQGGPVSYDTEVFFSIYTPPYPPGAWTPATFIVPGGINNPNGGSIPSLPGDDYSIRIASPTGSPTTPPSIPPPPPMPANPFWSWCGPTAVANSLWWFDSKFEPNNVSPPTISDGFPLVKSYNPGVWDDHDPRNVQPFIKHLAWLMDTDGQRTKICHCGTNVWDMQAGIAQYLSWSGVNPIGDVNGDGLVDQKDVNIVNNAMGSKPGAPNWNLAADIWPETVTGPGTADNMVDINDLNLVQRNLGEKGMFYEHTTGLYPDFHLIEEEVEKSQDVIILLGFYRNGKRDGGHFVTVAGVNSTTQQLLISNPIRDEFEAGQTTGCSPISHPYPHISTVHNNASLVSHDAYNVLFNSKDNYWFLKGYFNDPSWEARLEYAIITSPHPGVHDIAVTSVVPARNIIHQGFIVNITVTVENQGNYTETFNVTAYANTQTIGIKEVTLICLASVNVTFTWNTTNVTKGNYTLSAKATAVLGETDIADNTYVDEWMVITILGDVNGDLRVDYKDLFKLAAAYGSKQGEERFLPSCDFNNDGKIDYKDLFKLAANYGKKI